VQCTSCELQSSHVGDQDDDYWTYAFTLSKLVLPRYMMFVSVANSCMVFRQSNI